MRVIFMGTPVFSADILEDLALHHEVLCVYTQPDRVRSRGKKLIPTPVKEMALSLGIEVCCPTTLKDERVVEHIEQLSPQVICVAAYGMLLPKRILEIPPFGCINVHASLLPRWRGAAPVERAILAGDEQTGVSIMRMTEELDTGDHCVMRSIPVGDMTADELTSELAVLGSKALLTALAHLEDGVAHWTVQNDDASTYAGKIEKGELDPAPYDTAEQIVRKVRASSDAHPCRIVLGENEVRLVSAAVALSAENQLSAGVIDVSGNCLRLGCEDGWVEVQSLRPAGKKTMDVASFLAGKRNLVTGQRWSAFHV